jgi:orotate phosphoribosyltransferase
MQPEQVTEILKNVGAIRHGHFELSSGLHSDTYVQCALVLQFPRIAEQISSALAAKFAGLEVSAVVSPALGGVILGHEVARALSAGRPGNGVPAIFVERDASGTMTMRRGFSIEQGRPVLVVEDVWTTGGSTVEAIKVVEAAGGKVVAAGAIIDRSMGKLNLPVRAEALVNLDIKNYEARSCPLCAEGGVAVKPGSRFKKVGK